MKTPPHTCSECHATCRGYLPGEEWPIWLHALRHDFPTYATDELEALRDAAVEELALRRPSP